jgi:hypothetical protein
VLAAFKAAVTNFFLSRTLNAALPFAVLAIALWRGGWRQQLIALIDALQWMTDRFFPLPWIAATRMERGVRYLVGDLVGLAACLLALRGARRYWVAVVAGLALLCVAIDTLFLMTPSMSPYTLVRSDILISYAEAAVLIWAALTEPRAARAGA